MRSVVRPVPSLMFAVIAAFAAPGCAPRTPPAGAAPGPATPAAEATALPPVSAAPREAIPAWIDSVSPTGEAKDGAQVRVRFKHDLVPIEALEAPDRAAVLSHFTIEPALPGRFIILTPKMVGFQADAPIPHASRITVRLTAGLADRAGNALGSDYAWTFTTQPLTITNVLSDPDSIEGSLVPKVSITTSDRVDTASLIAHTYLIDHAHPSQKIAVELAPAPTPNPSASPDETAAPSDAQGPDTSDTGASYLVIPVETLQKATSYDVVVGPGVTPLLGNLPTDEEADGAIKTHGPLTFEGAALDGTAGRFSGGVPRLTFSNALDEDGVKAAISLSPPPVNALPLVRVDGDAVVFDSGALKPETTYTVHVKSSLGDVYGQQLASDRTATFSTGALAADIWAPTGLAVFPSGQNLALSVATTNLPQAAYRAAFAPLDPRALITHDVSGDAGPTALLPDKANWHTFALAQTKDVEKTTDLPLRSHLAGPTGYFVYGITARTVRATDANGNRSWAEPEFYGTVGLTDVGVFAQWFPESGIVRANHLGDGSPIPHAKIEIYESYTDTESGTASANEAPCATGTTGADGSWTLTPADFAPCASTATDSSRAPSLLVIAHDGADWAFARTNAYGDAYAYGLENTGWSAGQPVPLGTIVSDRTLYQPGEAAKFLGLSYFENDGVIGRGKSDSFAVTITSPSGAVTKLGNFAPDRFGAFTIPLTIGAAAELGYWTIAATGSGGEAISGTYRVAEFKPPNFSVDLTLDRAIAPAGSTVNARSSSHYLFGAPVEGGTSSVTVTRAQAAFSPPGWDAFSFGRQWIYPENPPSLSSDVLQQDVAIDAKGDAAVPIPVASDLPFVAQYTVSAQTTDVSHLAVADTKTFYAMPSDELIGLRSDFIATAGTPFKVGVIVTDPQGAPQTDRRVHLVLQRRIDTSATQIDEGSEREDDSVTYHDVASIDVDSERTAHDVTLTAPAPGDYRVRANFTDAPSEVTATDTQLWVAGPGQSDWYQAFERGITVKLDKATYRPGDTATALIESPYPDADLAFAVIRHGVLYATHRTVHGSGPQVRFTITPDMLPNAAVEAFLVRRGPRVQSGVPKGLKHLSSLGFATFEVALDGKYLKLDVAPKARTLEPAATQTVNVHLAGRDGRPVAGEFAIAVVNDAILQLSGYRFPDLVKMVYADQPISTRFGDSRDDVKLQPDRPSLEKGFGFGGGAMAGPAGTRVRTKFVPLAYWNGAVHTDAAGNGSVTFALPDDLTTWRVMVLGLSSDARFGNGEATFITTKPLVTNPVLPLFARPGDRFDASVAVTNVAHATGNLSVAVRAAGGVSFASGAPNAAQTSVPATGATQALRFAADVNGTRDATFTFSTKLGASSDAFAFGVPVLADDVLESTVTTGATTTEANVPLSVGPELTSSLGGLDVTAASTLLGEVSEPQEALSLPAYPFGTLLASRIAVASDALVLDRTYGRTGSLPKLRASIAADLGTLRRLALPDGGFADFPGEQKSDVFTTAFDVQQLIEAKAAGFAVNGDIAHARGYFGKVLANPRDAEGCASALCIAETRLEVLETLGALGDARTDFLSDIMAQQANFDYYERVELARFLLRLPAWHARGIALRDELFAQVNLSARHATVDVRGAFGESEVAGQAQMLGLAIASGTPQEDVDRLLQTLLDLRHAGRWGCECDDAEAMNALVRYAAQNATPPNFTATLDLPASPPKAVSLAFEGYKATLQTAHIPMNELVRGPATVRLAKTGSGTLHYVVALRYRAPDAAPGIYQGIRIDRVMRPAGSQTVLVTHGLAKPAGATSVVAGNVFDIEDRIVVDHPVDNVLVVDPLPAGFEAVDQTFRTASPADLEGADTWNVDYQELYKNEVVSFTSHLDAGSYAIHYLVRSVTPGTYAWPGASATLQFAPEEFGRTAASQLIVSEP